MTRYLNWLFLNVLVLASTNVFAHKASDSFIYLDQSHPEAASVRIDVALRDLALALSLDSNGDGQLTGAEVKAGRAAITAFVEAGIHFRSEAGSCTLRGTEWGLANHSDGPYAAASYDIRCPGEVPVSAMDYDLLFDLDPLHRGLVQWTAVSGESLAVMGPDQQQLDLASAPPSVFATFTTFIYEGVVHLLIGLDHILFLLVLILPATFVHRRQRRMARDLREASFGARLWQLAGIVTAFTVAHSITLALAALNIVQLPIAWVEMIIALSIVVAAVNVLWPILGDKTWRLAFGFGLIHGFGFASVLGDLTSGVSQTVIALAGFNIGVELGQLALLILVFPVLFLMGKYSMYARAGVPAMILVVSCISLYWVVERAGKL
ncbi:HupE/UreJ family protein [uncultured Marinobacter sp.]|uniref:HupE/UreJ family protein n=1 Tax=uncultured Marinobacter sp. TaxID=187379 RepID=UPI0030D71DC8